jgi:RNase adapter protein RapZ
VNAGAGEPGQVWILSGLSGAGKATALAALERHGVRCIDNLPAELAGALRAGDGPVVAVVDARQGEALPGFVPAPGVRVLFLDARDEVLVRRLADSTRPHPCARAGIGLAAVTAERRVLEPLRAAADVVVDTSALDAAGLGVRVVATVAAPDGAAPDVVLTLSSFGYKYGVQMEADWVVDARILRNPFWEPALRPLTGLDPAVRAHVLDHPPAPELLDRLSGLLRWTVEEMAGRRRTRLHVAVGCTGGRHRSVVVATELADRLRGEGVTVVLRHRDVERPDPR